MAPPTHAYRYWLLCGCVIATVPLGCQRSAFPEAATEAKAAEPPTIVSCARVTLHTWPRAVRVQGSLLGDEHAVIGAKVAGRVKDVRFDLGLTVAADAILVTLDTRDLEIQVRQAEAELQQVRAKLGLKADQDDQALDPTTVPSVLQEQAVWKDAKSKLKRAETLIAQNVVSDEELQERQAEAEVAEAKYRSALNAVDEDVALLSVRRAELGLAQQKLADATIVAPFAGKIEQRHIAPGVYLNVGQPVATLVRVDPLRFRAGVPEVQATRVEEGQEVLVSVEGSTEPLTARVSRISPSLDASSRALTIEADLPNAGSRLRTGLFAVAEIVVDPKANTLAVPEKAVFEFAGVEKVWLVRDAKAEERQVTTGRHKEPMVEIVAGLAEGDTIVADAREGRAGPIHAKNLEAGSPQSHPE
ncbi:MAG: efflux RND transporter periplasmic adaptor subunit [Rhodopirellula sp.]|nr:efflux RND transporter periplasmic adaptor subunit [Rhodopirellula sp.]